ncbi:MAG: response regulator [Endomicrobiales bacterium]|nr:response regulator [Endomicrobiales bacterium]
MAKGTHILVVDDEEEIVSFMQNFLKRMKIASTIATSGEEALALYDKDKIDCVFLDIHMEGIDGFKVLKRIKQEDPEAKVIIIAGSPEKEPRERAKALGAIDYISKPLDLRDLKEKIEKYVLKG